MEAIYWVIEGELAGRPGPVHTPWDPYEMSRHGIGGIVSLDDCGEIMDIRVVRPPLEHLEAYRDMLLLTDGRLRDEFLDELPEIFDFIDRLRAAGKGVLVHCHYGQDRTGTVLATYMMARQGVTAEEAIAHVRGLKRRALSAEGYLDTVHRFAERLAEEPERFASKVDRQVQGTLFADDA